MSRQSRERWASLPAMSSQKGVPKAKHMRQAFLLDMRVLWDRGVRTRPDMAKALGIRLATLDQRLNRARKDGDLPEAPRGIDYFDPFRTMRHFEGYYPANRKNGRYR